MIGRPLPAAMALAAVAAVCMAAGCSSSSRDSDAISSLRQLPVVAPPTTAEATSTSVTSQRVQTCEDQGLATATYPPLVSSGGFIEHLRALGRIRVGLDENTQGLSARDPFTGELTGFEVDLAHEIARRLFGDSYSEDTVVAVPLVTSEKTRAVEDQVVDITISAVTMSCKRWEQVDFSTEYYTAHQKFLVRSDSEIHDVADLRGRTVCVTSSSSSIAILESLAPDAKRSEEPARTDCLRALQQGEADAYFGHDTFLHGMLEQDPTLRIRALLDPSSTVSHYGIAVNRQYPELTRLINQYLADIVADGTWAALVCKSLTWQCTGTPATPSISPPVANYGREP